MGLFDRFKKQMKYTRDNETPEETRYTKICRVGEMKWNPPFTDKYRGWWVALRSTHPTARDFNPSPLV